MKKYLFGLIIALTLVASCPLSAETLSEHQANKPETLWLGTNTGFEVGAQVSDYRYQEHVVANKEFMNETGTKFGIIANATKAFSSSLFLTADSRIAYSSNDYQGSGTKSDNDDLLAEIRGVAGKDFVFENIRYGQRTIDFDISPYVGLGYRYLYNDLRGKGSTGLSGYQRESEYLYLPVGFTQRFNITNQSRLSTNIEYDHLLIGQQTSSLGDAVAGAGDVVNHQYDGYGLRGTLMYEMASWSAGPFFNYWNINASTEDCSKKLGCGFFEPHNQTIEYGVQAKYRF